jgi:hypothetical protein
MFKAFLTMAGIEQEILPQNLDVLIAACVENGFAFSVRFERAE